MAWLTLLYGILAVTIFSFLKKALQPGLRDIPGPFLAQFSNFWRLYTTWQRTFKDDIPVLHKRYGSSLVRIGPNLVSCSDPRAIDSIYGFHNEMQKVKLISIDTILVMRVFPIIVIKGYLVSNILMSTGTTV